MLDKYGGDWVKDEDGEMGFVQTDEKKQEFNLFADYPYNLTAEQVQIFDKENPEWVNFFNDRKKAVT